MHFFELRDRSIEKARRETMRTCFRIRAQCEGVLALLVLAGLACHANQQPSTGLEFAAVADKTPAALELDRARADGTKEHLHLQQPEHFAVKHAALSVDPQTGKPAVAFELKSEDAARFKVWTSAHLEQDVALLVNRRVYTVAKVMAPLEGASVITGGAAGFTNDEVKELIRALDADH